MPNRFENFIKSKSTLIERINTNGTKYLGEFKNKKYDGWGIFENKNYTYYGQFKNNRFYGLGLVKFKNNISFGWISGTATVDWSNDKTYREYAGKPSIFVGEFSGFEKLDGKGILLINNNLLFGDWWSHILVQELKKYVFDLASLIKEDSILDGIILEANNHDTKQKEKEKRIAEAKKKEEEAKQARDELFTK